ncbi:MAG: hypothetical protein RMI34_00035 [Chloroherpetonaceae bacterium]|nr:hypothetical protein [Chloroherpetonaceae bacterium]MCS7211602.1 hypothetical protein [Chloroherpetonaceae bacterium]MDW8018449.1 hypothetical protein [Chloroherpetonaceae bacterium]MDW8466417.1 hypothetical protein [Chloroherpetonaceae bacterium]
MMKQIRLSFLNWLLKRARPNSKLQQIAKGLVGLELLGVRWYSPIWQLKSVSVYVQRWMMAVRREWRGYQKPMAHPNPEAIICAEFSCRHSIDGKCAMTQFAEPCLEQCFGMKRTEQGTFVPLFTDYEGNPAWLEISCRDCKKYLTECKGTVPNAINPVKENSRTKPDWMPLTVKPS